jgi:hypothetical protein
MKWYDPQPQTSRDPLSAHDLMRAHDFVRRGGEVVAAAKTREQKKAVGDVKRAVGFMAFWLRIQAEDPIKRQFIREQLACLPAVPELEVIA